MSREILDNIFKPFYSASSGGTGLGMLIIKSIMEAHKGAVEVDSVPGEGTTITLSLPLTH
jgi:signal transduction histidine kinase